MFILGVCIGLFVAFAYTAKNIPAGTSVEIGKLKIRGRDHQVDTNIDITPDNPDPDQKNKRRRKN